MNKSLIVGPMRQTRPIVAVTLLMVTVSFYMLNRAAPWRGDTIWGIDYVAGSLVLLAPVVAALSAFSSSRSREFTSTLGSSRISTWLKAFYSQVLPLWILAIVVLGLWSIIVVLTAISSKTLVLDWTSLLSLVLAGLSAATATTMGASAGQAIRNSFLAAGLSAGAMYLLEIWTAFYSLPELFPPGGATQPIAGLAVRFVSVAHIAFFALGLILAATCAAARKSGRQFLTRWTRAGTIIGIVMALVACALPKTPLYGNDGRTTPTECLSKGTVVVCMARTNSSHLSDWTVALEAGVSGLRRRGVEAVSAFRQEIPFESLPAGVAPLPFTQDLNKSGPSRMLVAQALAAPSVCPLDMPEPAQVAISNGRYQLQTWVAYELFGPTKEIRESSEFDLEMLPGLKAGNQVALERWAVATLSALKTCTASGVVPAPEAS